MFDKNVKRKEFDKKIWLASPTIYPDSMHYMKEAYETNWMSTVGKNIDEVEKEVAARLGCAYAVALASGTASIHMAVKLAGIKENTPVFCSDMTFVASANPILYQGGKPIFIDSEYETWNMDPEALEKAFELYPDVKHVLLVHLYGTPAKLDEIQAICKSKGAVLIEDAAESLGARYKGQETGTFGEHAAISFNGNKIITGSSGGMFLTESKESAERIRKWSTQAREKAIWYQHEEIGYNYRMSNVIAGIVRGQLPYLDEHIRKKKCIYEKYKEGFKGLPVTMNPFDERNSEPNFWLSCMMIKPESMCRVTMSDKEAKYLPEHGKSSPGEILEAIQSINAEGRPIWKPMHMQPIFRSAPFINRNGNVCLETDDFTEETFFSTTDHHPLDVGRDIFVRGLCLPSDIKMTSEDQDVIIDVVKECFD